MSAPRQVTPLPKEKAKKGRRSPTAAALKKRAVRLWGEYIHLRDRVCQFCGKADGKLDAHHIMLRSQYVATIADPTNGVLLCFKCHQNVAHGDPFEAFRRLSALLGADEYERLRERAYSGVGGKYGVDFWRGQIAELEDLLERVR